MFIVISSFDAFFSFFEFNFKISTMFCHEKRVFFFFRMECLIFLCDKKDFDARKQQKQEVMMLKIYSFRVYPMKGSPFTVQVKARSQIEALCVVEGMFKDAVELRATVGRKIQRGTPQSKRECKSCESNRVQEKENE